MTSNAALFADKQVLQTTTTGTDFGSFQVRRNTSHSGGTPGFVCSGLRVDTFTTSAVTNFEWAGTFVMHNSASAGENVAVYGQGIKNSTSPTWGAVNEVIDNTGPDPTTGAVGLEVDVNGNGTDANSSRVAIDVAIRRPGGTGAAMQASYGLRFQNSGDTSTFLKTAIGFVPGMSVGLGIDLSPATITGAAVKLAQAQAIVFDVTATPPKLTSQGLGLDHLAGSTLVNRLLATGGLQVASAQVVGPRITGWGTATGGSKAAFTAGTATLPQTAAAVAQLIADLTSHGLIGA